MPNNLPSVNFAGNKQPPLLERLMDWTLTIGRLIVIITEIIAITAFIYRFSLDEQLANIRSSIRDQKAIISNLRNDESKYRNLQDRLDLISTFSKKATKTNQTITDIANLIPSSVQINSLVVNMGRVDMSVDLHSTSDLKQLVSSLEKYNNTSSISINNLENKPSAGIAANITAMLK